MKNKNAILEEILSQTHVLYDKPMYDLHERQILSGEARFTGNYGAVVIYHHCYPRPVMSPYYFLVIVNIGKYEEQPKIWWDRLICKVESNNHNMLPEEVPEIPKINILDLMENENSIIIKYQNGTEIKSKEYKLTTETVHVSTLSEI